MSKIQLHAYILIAVMGFAILGAKAIRPVKESKVVTDFALIPMDIGDWSGFQRSFDDETRRLLPSCSLLLRSYDDSDAPPVTLAIVYGTNLGDFHQPEQCLEGQGLRSIRKGGAQVKGADGKPFDTNTLIMDNEYQGRQAFVYWFTSGGTTATFLGSYKTKVFLSRLRSRKIVPSALVRLSTDVSGTDEEAIRRLVGFAEVLVPYLNEEFSSSVTGADPAADGDE